METLEDGGGEHICHWAVVPDGIKGLYITSCGLLRKG